MVRTKVFVGNLSFNTRENELAKEFEVAGKVISANIITRGPRSLGYGFVEMDNEADAENAVKMLDKKEIDGRPINVEVAKPREEGADTQGQTNNAQRPPRAPRNRGPRSGDAPSKNADRPSRPPRAQGQGQGQSQGQNNTQGGNNGSQFRRRRSDDDTQEPAKRAQRPPRATRPARAEGEADNRTPSQTTLFVANLPFSIDDDSFSKVLKDASLAYKTAHVVKKRTGRSKGFGFIEFENESDQQKALAALNDKDVDGRPLSVKVALTELRSEDLQQAPAKTATPAPAKTSSPAPAKATSSPAPAKTSSPAPVKSATTGTASPKQDKK